MHGLLEDLLTAARLRSMAFSETSVDLARLAAEAAEEYLVLAEDHRLRLDLRLPPGPQVFADPEALSRAISNLLSNAVNLAPTDSTVTVAAGSRAGWAWIAVQDQGPGIAEPDQDAVFDRFHRGAQADTGRPRRGSGLGLPISRQIVESLGGRLMLFSQLGVGSTFVIWLPDRALSHLASDGTTNRSAQPPTINPVTR